MHRLLLVLLSVCVATATARAQTPAPVSTQAADATRVLEISGGQMLLDGRAMPPSSLPPGLDLNGITRSLEFSGPVTPYIEVTGKTYVLQDGGLVAVEEARRTPEQVYVLFLGQPGSDPSMQMPEQQLVRLGEEAYLRQLSDRDRNLYEQIRQEQALDRAALALAERARAAPAGPERTRLRAELRAQLAEAFALKLAIHREEIRRAEDELTGLRRQLDEREAMKQAIVDMRLRELLGG